MFGGAGGLFAYSPSSSSSDRRSSFGLLELAVHLWVMGAILTAVFWVAFDTPLFWMALFGAAVFIHIIHWVTHRSPEIGGSHPRK